MSFEISPVGYVRSALKERAGAPKQGWEGAPGARLEILPEFAECLEGVEAGQEIWILTWLHEGRRSVMKVRPRGDMRNPLTGVFATRSPDRPNPIGLHRAKVLSVGAGGWLEVEALEAIDGTPVVDIKPVLERGDDAGTGLPILKW
jgi:tRNA-Thr(GGU) m(6)t(6)A37 methyltransferase TsaA